MTDPFPFPAVQPGVTSPPMDSSEKRVKRLQKQQDALANRDLSNSIVGQGSTFRATVVDGGSNVIRIGKGAAAYGSRQTMVMRDISNKVSYALDELAGYGLSHPSLTYQLTGVESQGPALPTTVGAGALIATGSAYCYNPAWHIQARLRFANGAAAATAIVTATWRRIDGTVIGTASQTFSIGSNVFTVPTFERMMLLAAVDMGARISVELKVHVNTGPDLSVQAFPFLSTGISMALYDLLPSLH